MNFLIVRAFFAFLFSLLITLYLIPPFIIVARRLRLVDEPDNHLKHHAFPVPYLGGVAIYCGFLVAIALTLPLDNQMFSFLVGSTLLLFVGLIDDLMVLKPYQKFFGQMVAAFIFLKGGLYLKERFFYNYWSIGLSLFWILSIINAFNLVDVMDGLATLLAISAAGAFLAIAYLFGQHTLMILIAACAGACIAFFYYNRPPATIYLGDAGSLFLGGFFATLPFLFAWNEHREFGYGVSILILAIPALEITMLVLVRTHKGIPFYRGTPDHFSLVLQRKGWNKGLILLYSATVSCLLSGIMLLFLMETLSIEVVVALVGAIILTWVTLLLL